MIKQEGKKLKLKSRAQPAGYLDLCKGEGDVKKEWKRMYLLQQLHGHKAHRKPAKLFERASRLGPAFHQLITSHVPSTITAAHTSEHLKTRRVHHAQ